ncbi:MAG: TetR/AcrR family transcriptional regulator [Eubacteriales bacterium]|nr:TetR/AcrR family transcriptional regulator [Eubacteriales bacterium]
MPKQKITKEMVVDAAFELARAGGMEQVMVKNIAEKLGCSVQPIYSYCKNMDGLRKDVTERARQFIQKFVAAHIDKNDLFRSTGRAYIQIAKEEPHILKMFIFQQRKNISSLDDLYQCEASPQMAQTIADELNITVEKAKQLHLNMLIYTIGIGTIFSVTTPGIPPEEIYSQQENAYRVFLRAALEENNDEQ